MTGTLPGIAFFDVDETLISFKTMFDFYDFFLAALGHTPAEQKALGQEARGLLRSGLSREQGNRLFYRRFAGHEEAQVAEIGRQWFGQHLERGGIFHGEVLDALRAHQAAGRLSVLVSGSFPACLDPLARYCGTDLTMCTELEIRNGIYTGDVTRTMIGDAKEGAARAIIEHTGVSAADCYAYGDHTSDAGMLALVGHPFVVGEDPELAAVAARNRWPRLTLV